MKVRLSLLLVLVSGLTTGCVSNSASLRPTAQTQANTAPKVHRAATRVLTPQFGKNADKLPAIDVRLTNGGSEPIEFSPAQITAFADDKPIKVYDLAEYQRLVEGEIKVDYVAAETSEQSALIRAQWNNNKPGTTSILQAKADAATKRMEIKHKRTKLLGGLEQMLQAGAIAPGHTVGGTIRLQGLPLLPAQRLRLRIVVGSETHEVDFSVSR